MWRGLKEFLTYNQQQRNGLLTLLIIALLLQVAIYLVPWWFSQADNEAEQAEFNREVEAWRKADSLASWKERQPRALFSFDPNTASDSALRALGFPAWLAQRLIRYRQSGGHFSEKGDLLKLYDMDTALYHKIHPYISLPDKEEADGERLENPWNPHSFDLNQVTPDALIAMGVSSAQAQRIVNYRQKVKPYDSVREMLRVYYIDSALVEQLVPYARVAKDSSLIETEPEDSLIEVEINGADSLALLKLRGVGPYFAMQILRYRKRLGGFYHKEQILEVYRMDSARFAQFAPQLRLDTSHVQRLDLNRATFKDLVRHPYLEYEVVKNIVSFREDVRPFKNTEELRHIELIDDQLFSKIAKYLSVSEETH